MTILVDSSVLIDALRNRRGRTEFLELLTEHGHVLACCSVNITEVYAGMRDSESAVTDKLLVTLECFPVTRDIARQAGLLKREWARKGVTISYTDVTIAAVALANGLSVLTDNVKDFPMPGLRLHPLPPA